MNALADPETDANEIEKVYNLMTTFVGLCLCDENGGLIADDSQETIDFLMGIDDDQILIDLYAECSKVSGLYSLVAKNILEAFEELEKGELEATTDSGKKKTKSQVK
jgi:hypothetical protein